MRTLKKILFGPSLAILAIILFAGCGDDESVMNGTLSVQLTDEPFPTDEIKEANVTIEKIDIRRSEDNDGNPFLILSESEQSYNLLDLSNGVTADLVTLEVPAGNYDLIRLFVKEASIKLADDTEFQVTVPSGPETGIKVFIDPPIEVAGGLSAELLLDFDVSRSFIVLGDPDTPAGINGFNFVPVIRATNLSTAGRITGVVTDASGVAIEGAQVEALITPTVFATTFSDANGNYALIGLEAGTYDVAAEKDGFIRTTIMGVEVVAGNATSRDIELTPE